MSLGNWLPFCWKLLYFWWHYFILISHAWLALSDNSTFIAQNQGGKKNSGRLLISASATVGALLLVALMCFWGCFLYKKLGKNESKGLARDVGGGAALNHLVKYHLKILFEPFSSMLLCLLEFREFNLSINSSCCRCINCYVSWRLAIFFKRHHKKIGNFGWWSHNRIWGLWNCLQISNGWWKRICFEKNWQVEWGLWSLFWKGAWNSWKHKTPVFGEFARILQLTYIKIVNIWLSTWWQPWWSSSWWDTIFLSFSSCITCFHIGTNESSSH